jgi:hypothetical protein
MGSDYCEQDFKYCRRTFVKCHFRIECRWPVLFAMAPPSRTKCRCVGLKLEPEISATVHSIPSAPALSLSWSEAASHQLFDVREKPNELAEPSTRTRFCNRRLVSVLNLPRWSGGGLPSGGAERGRPICRRFEPQDRRFFQHRGRIPLTQSRPALAACIRPFRIGLISNQQYACA